jgi:hypothetical protein
MIVFYSAGDPIADARTAIHRARVGDCEPEIICRPRQYA